MLKNEGSCNDGNVVLSKRYKAYHMESGKDASVLESMTVYVRSNKCQPHVRERINSSSLSPNNHFITKNLESTQRERRKIRGINQELSIDNKRLKRAKGSGSRRWEYNCVVRGKLDSTADLHPDIEGRNSHVESVFKMGRSSADEEVSTSGRMNESDTGGEGGLEQFLGFLGQLVSYPPGFDAFKNFVKPKVAHLVKGIWLGIEEQESELKKAKSDLEKNLARAKTDALKEVKQLKAAHTVAIGQLQVKAKANLDEMAEEYDRLGRHLMLNGYSQEEVDAIKADTYVVEEEEEAEVVREMSLRINNLESRLARERETLKALLSAQEELQAELDASRVREDHALMCNREFAKQFDRMKEVNKNREDRYVKAYIKLEKLNQVVSDLTRQIEEKDSRIKKGLKYLSVATKHVDNLQRQVDALAMKGNVQKGNANLRECQHKLDAALIREKVMEGEIRAKDFLVKMKDELLKDLPAREELNTYIMKLCARVVELETINLSESAQYIAKLKEDAIYHDRVDADIIAWKDTWASLKVRLERLKTRFAKAVVPDVAQSDLLKVIVAYFVKEVKKLESERDTLLKTLSDKGYTCGAKIV
ncbi:hypothetical protein GIB67_018053 [Kingdonia uniflora]|uniref:Uncharacterized protein n=1 Tax=Kingdonia uniflora TaxID=39325 RepID=A0A7J7NWJ1_9MAGN|nr:hypothetical protein GIB67_018053 [Kingdonia uniflora]